MTDMLPLTDLQTPGGEQREQGEQQEQQQQGERGYNKYSGWMSCSRHFFVLRQFRKLNVRILLAMQDEIVELEEELQELDKKMAKDSDKGSFEDSFRAVDEEENSSHKRHKILWEIQEKLKLYNEHWVAFQSVADRPRVDSWDIESVQGWHRGSNKGFIAEEEQAYLKEKDELVYVLPPMRLPPLERLVSKAFKQESAGKDDKTVLLNKRRARRVLRFFTLPFAMFMLIGPLWILNILPNVNARLGGITGFVLLLALYLVLSTPAKAEVVWGTTAAYAAVLMVFLQIQNSNA